MSHKQGHHEPKCEHCESQKHFDSSAHNPFGIKGEHHQCECSPYPNWPHKPVDGNVSPEDFFEEWRKFKRILMDRITEYGIPRDICPQKGYVHYTVGHQTCLIDVKAFSLIFAQNLPDRIFIPVRKIEAKTQHRIPGLLMFSRPLREELVNSFEAYKVMYFTEVERIFAMIEHWDIPEYKPDYTKTNLFLTVSNEFARFYSKITDLSESYFNKNSINDIDCIRLW